MERYFQGGYNGKHVFDLSHEENYNKTQERSPSLNTTLLRGDLRR